jgi:uncharacterized protein
MDLIASNGEAAAADAGPVTSASRIATLDTIRGVALFGILLVNITAFGLPDAYFDPSNSGGSEGAPLYAWLTTQLFFEGTQRSLFALLFGAGVILLTSRMEARGAGIEVADIYYRRNIWLVIFGMVHAYVLLWDGDILYQYGIVALFLFPLRRALPRTLFALGAGALLISFAWLLADYVEMRDIAAASEEAWVVVDVGGEPTDEQLNTIEAWEEELEEAKPDEEQLQEAIDERTGSYWTFMKANASEVAEIQSWDLYRYIFLDVFAMMVFGMALFKLGLLTERLPLTIYWLMILVGYGVGLTANVYEARTILEADFGVVAFAKANVTYDVGRVGVTVGHLGLLLLWCHSGLTGWLKTRLAAVGRMALTNYVMHSVICLLVFSGIGLGLYGRLQRHELYVVVAGICLLQLIVSPIWLRHYRFGPLEWVWRSLTYQKKLDFRQTRMESTP